MSARNPSVGRGGRARAPPAAPALPAQSIKRDGARVPFELAKIASAIARAGAATGEFDAARRGRWPTRSAGCWRTGIADGAPDIEAIQDSVEHTLAAAGWFHTARAYIVYRDRHARLRADRKTLVDVAASVDEYLRAAGLARQRQRQPGLFARRADPQRVGQGRSPTTG